jgi:glycosyltransferase involved in cell wall biosynthesis
MIAIVIPCYKVSAHICDLIRIVGDEVGVIFVIDDCCPEKSGALVERNCKDPRVQVIYHKVNQGVGGAVLTGYQAAIREGAAVIVKLDGDGQMDPALIPAFTAPILSGEADYTKGNRFFEIESVRQMPLIRIIGNIGLSFLTKLSSGYWNLFDPTNGYTAISAKVAERLPVDKISQRYFFESDMLFRLNTMRAVVMDIPMDAKYEDEQSNLKVSRELPHFLFKNLRNLGKRIAYNYFIRNFNYATLGLLFGLPMLGFGVIFGAINWIEQSHQGTLASAGTVMLAALPMLMGIQLILSFFNYDMASVPTTPIQGRLHLDARCRSSLKKKPGIES